MINAACLSEICSLRSPSAALMISQVWCRVSKHLLNLARLPCDGRLRMSVRLSYTAANQPLALRCTPFHLAVGLSHRVCPIKVNGVEVGLLWTLSYRAVRFEKRNQRPRQGNAKAFFQFFKWFSWKQNIGIRDYYAVLLWSKESSWFIFGLFDWCTHCSRLIP